MRDFKSVNLLELILVLLIAIFGALLYFYKLESIPPGLYVDEALSGYNAYSILETGRDEYGKSFPILFRFFGSYSPPLYTYLSVIPVKIFGLNVFATRFISALTAVLGIVLIYVFLKKFNVIKNSSVTPIIGALLFCISPWNVLFARTGYEIYLGFILFLMGVLFIWLGFIRRYFLILGLGVLSLSTYGAHAERYIVPLFILGLVIFFRNKLNYKFFGLGVITALIIQLPHLIILNTPAFFTKNDLFLSGILNNTTSKLSAFFPPTLSFLLSFIWTITAKIFTYFSPASLFLYPDDDLQRSLPELSIFYPWMLIPYFLGWFVLVKNFKSLEGRFLILLLAVTVLPAALTKDAFSTQRALPLLLPLILIISLGMDKIISFFNLRVWLPLIVIILLISLTDLWRSYFVFLPNERAQIWGYGFKELTHFIEVNSKEKFIIDQSRIKPAYIELAFYLKYPPGKFQQTVDQTIKEDYYSNTEFSTHYNFGNIETRNIDFKNDVYTEAILVGDELTISSKQADEHYLEKVFEIDDPLGFIIFQGFRTSPIEKCKSINGKNKHCDQIRWK